jgi:hypothetical protein
MLGQDGVIIPSAFADEVLHRTDLALVVAFQLQHHRFYCLVLDFGRQQPVQVSFTLFPLLATPEQWMVNRLIFVYFIQQAIEVLWRQIHLWRCSDNRFHAAPQVMWFSLPG